MEFRITLAVTLTLFSLSFAHPTFTPCTRPSNNPTAAATRKSISADPSWTISQFCAINVPSNNYSAASFVFRDDNPMNEIMLVCSIAHPIYRERFTPCGKKLDLLYKLGEGEITLRRTYSLENKNRVTGTASQGTYWNEGTNQTKGKDWTAYYRAQDWSFTVSSMVG